MPKITFANLLLRPSYLFSQHFDFTGLWDRLGIPAGKKYNQAGANLNYALKMKFSAISWKGNFWF
jgi:hypothetical protein